MLGGRGTALSWATYVSEMATVICANTLTDRRNYMVRKNE